jgi:hypothetical protein
MKAVAVALVLIAGAAVVLWYGNTLNSWVLGGLIGGLAALLLSIPISLTLFSYLSKRHDERLQAEEQEEIALARENDYPDIPARIARRPREVESYVVTDETAEESWQDGELYEPRQPRALPAPSPQRREPLHQSSGNRNSDRVPVPQQGTSYVPAPRAQQPRPKGKETTVLRPTTRKIGAAGYEPPSTLSQHRSEALRTARLEAAKQRQDDEIEVIPNNTPKRGVSVRPNQALAKQDQTAIRPPRPSRQLPPQAPPQRPARRIVDSAPSQHDGRQSFESEQTVPPQRREPHTDYISHQLPQTGPVRRPSQAEQAARLAQEHEQRAARDETMGSVNRPLVRRAPYMYEDDPLRQELAQQLDAPAVRRSSRFDDNDDDDDE